MPNVCQAIHLATDLVKILHVKLTHKNALLITRLSNNVAPRVNNHGVAVRHNIVIVLSNLRRCDHVHLILNCSSPQQSFPVIAASLSEKCCGHQKDLRATQHQLTVKLGKAQVITD